MTHTQTGKRYTLAKRGARTAGDARSARARVTRSDQGRAEHKPLISCFRPVQQDRYGRL